MDIFGFNLFGTLCTPCAWMSVSFPWLGKFSAFISSDKFSVLFSLSFPFGIPIMEMLVCLMLFHHLINSDFLNFFFNFYCSDCVISNILYSRLLIHYSVTTNLLLIPSSVFLISVVVFFSSDWIFIIFSKSLLKFPLNSSILLPSS